MTNIPFDRQKCEELIADCKEAVKQLHELHEKYSALNDPAHQQHNTALRLLLDDISKMRLYYLYIEHYAQTILDTLAIAVHTNADPAMLTALKPTKELIAAYAKWATETYQLFLEVHKADEFKTVYDAISANAKNNILANRNQRVGPLMDLINAVRKSRKKEYHEVEQLYRFRRGTFSWRNKEKMDKSTLFEIQAIHNDETIDLAIVTSLPQCPHATPNTVDTHTMRMFSKIPLRDAEKEIERHLIFLQDWLIGKILEYKGSAGLPADPGKLRETQILAMRLGILKSDSEIQRYSTQNLASPEFGTYKEYLRKIKKLISKAHKKAGGMDTSPITYEMYDIPGMISHFLEHLRTSPLPHFEQYELVHGADGLLSTFPEILRSIADFRREGTEPQWAKEMERLFKAGAATP